MKKVIPEVVTYFCDLCGIELKGLDLKNSCKIKMTSAGLDHAGHAVGSGTGGEFYCCSNCYLDTLMNLKGEIII